ncbi:hypothetical protein AY601_4721 [Pedobacter cryoconitis]|uniref:Cyclic nucleotide-binding domain-containing protein n=1 Tax=Pedobacter cryoconitis TaxID=188932 RepID=A0A127VJT3_9SPHI|nr:hypothetical protein AY601_4721 [Pedobacter cryoconitis]
MEAKEIFKPQPYKKGQVIIDAGKKAEQEYFIISSCLKAFFINLTRNKLLTYITL